MKNSAGLLFVSSDYPPNDGGVSRLSGEIVAGLARRGAHVQALVLPSPDDAGGPPQPGVPESRIRAHRLVRELKALHRLRRVPAAVTVVCSLWYPEGFLAAVSHRGPLVILAHGAELLPPSALWRRTWWPRLARWVLERAALVIANSEYTRCLILKAAPRARSVALPLAVDVAKFTPEDREGAKARLGVVGRHVISSVSRLCQYKGHEVIFQALARLDRAVSERFVYLVSGKGPAERMLRARATELGLEFQVRWMGHVPEEKLPDVYRASDLFVLCTRASREQREIEGFGLVFLEAQACGTPAVGTRTGGIPDAIRDGEGGWLIEQDDVTKLSGILLALARDPAHFHAAGRAARLRIERECTWNHYLDRFTAALAEVSINVD